MLCIVSSKRHSTAICACSGATLGLLGKPVPTYGTGGGLATVTRKGYDAVGRGDGIPGTW